MMPGRSVDSTKGPCPSADLEIKMRPILLVEFYLAMTSSMDAGVELVRGDLD